jgi:predicted membrane-bound mannosyltransferase
MNDLKPVQALAQVNAKIAAQDNNRPLYLVVTEETANKYLTPKLDYQLYGIELVGYEADAAMRKALEDWTSWSQVVQYVSTKDKKIISKMIPWHRVMFTQNLSYKAKT